MRDNNVFHENYCNLNFSNSVECNELPRYRWYSYKEGFSPRLVEEAFNRVNFSRGDYVLDPFNGTGTVTLTASLNNISSIGIEVNPFVAFVSAIKLSNTKHSIFHYNIERLIDAVNKNKKSGLLNYSTFSEKSLKNKWLFNSVVLNSFESGWRTTKNINGPISELFQLALIGAAMDNCNAVKDGKCLKYRPNWKEKDFSKQSFINSLVNRLNLISEDLKEPFFNKKSFIINEDSRTAIKRIKNKFRLCITSPPYLNSFDYTDIYRPELYLGKFITCNEDLAKLRTKTIRSHMEIKLPNPNYDSFGELYRLTLSEIVKAKYFWDKQIPTMIQSYFEDMHDVLSSLKMKAHENAQLWLIVGNSVYVETEIPVDLIIAEIGTRIGWKLLKIEVLRYIQRRKTKYNGNIVEIRESLIIFTNN